jgi:hypothetical protein
MTTIQLLFFILFGLVSLTIVTLVVSLFTRKQGPPGKQGPIGPIGPRGDSGHRKNTSIIPDFGFTLEKGTLKYIVLDKNPTGSYDIVITFNMLPDVEKADLPTYPKYIMTMPALPQFIVENGGYGTFPIASYGNNTLTFLGVKPSETEPMKLLIGVNNTDHSLNFDNFSISINQYY